MTKLVYTLIFLCLCFKNFTYSQDNYKFYITHNLLFSNFEPSKSSEIKNGNQLNRGLELSFSKYIKKNIAFIAPIKVGFTKNSDDTSKVGRIFYGGDAQFAIAYSRNRVSPYLASGISLYSKYKKVDLGLPIYIGMKLRIENSFFLNIQSGYRYSLGRNKDSYHHSVGLTFGINKISAPKNNFPILIKNTKIVEELDIIGWWQIPKFNIQQCKFDLSTLPKFEVVDSDNDSVPDIIDKCPTVVGLVSNAGCPVLEDLSWLRDSNTINFAFGKAELKLESYAFLDKIANLIERKSNIIVHIQGHTDNIGSAQYNKQLSTSRAKTCFDYLISKGISSKNLLFIGYGEDYPIADNSRESGRMVNRRVEFSVTKEF